MGEALTITLRDDLYDEVLDEHTESGRSKSEIVNDWARDGLELRSVAEAAENGTTTQDPSLADTLLPVFGQSLFIAGFVLAFFITLGAGVGTSILGLAMLIGAKSDEYAKAHGVDRRTAFVRVLGA